MRLIEGGNSYSLYPVEAVSVVETLNKGEGVIGTTGVVTVSILRRVWQPNSSWIRILSKFGKGLRHMYENDFYRQTCEGCAMAST